MANESFEDMSMQDMLDAIKSPIPRIQIGDIVKGSVISVTSSEVFVNIGYMSDGVIPKEELTDDGEANPKDLLKAGDEIYVYILEINDGEGNVLLSKKMADAVKVWDDLETWMKEEKTLNVKISEVVKGGAVAYLKGLRAFIPASQLSISYVKDINDYLGKEVSVKIIEFDEDKNKIILSAKEVEAEEKRQNEKRTWEELKKGEMRTGVVTRLVNFGAFVDLGGVDGLIHNSDLSWERVTDPSKVVSVGDKVEVYVIDFDKAKGRISLGLKEISKDPWNTITERYKVGDVVTGSVVKLMSFGAIVELESGIEGFLHISEMSEERISNPSSILAIGQSIKVKVIEINLNDKKISLSLKNIAEGSEEDYSEYNNNNGDMTTLGDLFKDKFKDFKFD